LNPEDSTLTLTNCRFINNTVTGIGGGVWNGSTNATLVDCVFSGNSAHDGQIPYVSEIIPGSGGGMSAGGTPTLIRCTFRSNYATNGAGIIGGSGELAECAFTGNSAVEDGGAIHTGGDPIITNCTFSGNSANRGGGIFFTWGAKMTMANCTFAGNSASTGNALASDPHLPSLPGYFQLTNCILWDGEDTIFDPDPYALRSAITYSNIQGGWPGEGNMDADPCFVDPGYWADANDPNIVAEPNDPNAVWIEGDYHLKSQAGRYDPNSGSWPCTESGAGWVQDDVTSPCIDAGDPMSPIGHEPFPNGGIINMGAYGGTAEASKSYFGEPVCETIVAGDINGDCKVDFVDFTLMATHWLEDVYP
jgi:predicted outer membrane repeat protein